MKWQIPVLSLLLALPCTLPMAAQVNGATATAAPSNPSQNAPLTLTLQDALARARKINPDYHLAQTDYKIAKEDKVQSRSLLLPNVNYTNSFLYTEGGGLPGVGRFVANNGVHEYVAQGDAHQEFSIQSVAEYRRFSALQQVAQAHAEIAARGLIVTVVQAYYGMVAAERKYVTSQHAYSEAQRFLKISRQLENGGEVAHSDVIKAQIQFQQQQRDLEESQLAMDRGRIELAVLVFPDFNQNFTVVDDMQLPEALPSFPEVQAATARKNPEIRSALASLQAANQEVTGAWNGFLPSLAFDYFYGIDANQFATEGRFDPIYGLQPRNLGYAAEATLQLPIWNWGASRSKLKQAGLRREQARVELSATQRELLGRLREFYAEAGTARLQLASLAQTAQDAAESLRLTTLRYQAGEATVLEVVDAQNTLTMARNAYDDGQVRFRVAMANLQTLTGTM
jgi:outer membrane protein TolC